MQPHSRETRGRQGVPVTNTANLQSSPTVKQLAARANVSERMIYDTLKLHRSGRPDLCSRVMSGELTVHRALVLAGVKTTRPQGGALIAAWRRAAPSEQAAFLEWLRSTPHDLTENSHD